MAAYPAKTGGAVTNFKYPTPIFRVSTDAGGVGLNLQSAGLYGEYGYSLERQYWSSYL